MLQLSRLPVFERFGISSRARLFTIGMGVCAVMANAGAVLAEPSSAPSDESVILHAPPARVVEEEGAPLSLTVEIHGSATFQWEIREENESSWTTIPGATGHELSLITPNVRFFCSVVRCRLQSPSGHALLTSETRIVPRRRAPRFAEDLPETVVVRAGESATLRVRFDEGERPTYLVWRRVGEPGATPSGATEWLTPPLTLLDDGAQFFVEAVNDVGNHVCGEPGETKSQVTTVRVQPNL